MLITFMYHRIINAGVDNPGAAFERHLAKLAESYHCVIPGDTLSANKPSVCLTFDDAYFDLYHYIFPLLKKYQLKALVGVSTKYILPKSDVPTKQRLMVPAEKVLHDGVYQEQAPFCTWQELDEMQQSGLIYITSHTHSHPDLTKPNVDFEQEIIQSKAILEDNLKCKVNTFIYPYGNTNLSAHAEVLRHYDYAMRIGSAINRDWHNHNNYIYRIDANHYWPHGKILNYVDWFNYYMKYLSNIWRGK